MSRLLLLMAAGMVALSAQTPVGGPTLGYIYDAPGQALRPILGIPGASIFGDPLQTAAPISAAAVSLRQNVAIMNEGGWNAMTLTGSAALTTIALPDGLPTSAQVAVSETGTAAAFYDSVNNVLSVVSGIGTANMAMNPVNLASLPGAITALAAGDDGSLLLSSAITGGGEGLFWIGQDGSVRQLASLQATASILLWNQGGNALVTDKGANQIWQILAPGGNAAITLAASVTDGVSGPTGAALSADGSELWIANEGTRTVLGVNVSSRATVSVNCAFDLTTVLPLTDGVSFRLNDLTSGPVWVVDTTPTVGPRVVFIPAVQRAAADAASEEAAQ